MPKEKTWSYEFKNDDTILIKDVAYNREYIARWEMINDKPVIKLIKTRLPKWLTTELQFEIYKKVYGFMKD
jgi:hypothetical protein